MLLKQGCYAALAGTVNPFEFRTAARANPRMYTEKPVIDPRA
jgi:hypothetical protein